MDGTQTSEPTETGPGSPGLASAFRRALDEQAVDQAVSDGPLDLTAPLNIAEVRAALSTGSIPVVRADLTAAAAGARPPHSPGVRRPSRHASTKRLVGRIAVFVALAAAMSVGTACALVLTSGGQGSSVSLPPTTGNIPVAPSEASSEHGQLAVTGGSAPATAVSSLLRSPTASASTASPSASASASATASSSASDSPSASAGASGGAGASGSPSGAAPANSPSSNWVTLYWGIQNEQQEVSEVQSLLADIGYLNTYRRHSSYYNPQVNVQPDQNGTYGSATDDAVAEFQRDFGVNHTGQAGTCDQATYEALEEEAG